jgi:uncharacterized protein YycO
MTELPRIGTIGLTQISGDVGRLIRIGQWLNGDGFADFQHAFVYIGNGQLVEAEPGGARIMDVGEYDHSTVYWCSNLTTGISDADLQAVADIAKGFEHTPYSALDYFALAAKRLHIPAPQLNAYIKSTGHMICSQLAAAAYDQGKHPLYDHWTGWVTPLDIYNLDRSQAK